MPPRLLLADDHAVLRSGLRLLLTSQNEYEVVGEASSGTETLTLAEELQPDLILLDLSMPALGGLDALPALRKLAPAAKILILTMHDDPQYLRQALKQGASGYVLKKAADSELLSAIKAVLRGEMYVHPSMTRVLLEDMLPASRSAEGENAWETLSEREQEVLKMVALGHTSGEIAEQLNLSAKTVETYRARGMEKLGLRTRAALVKFALQEGLIKRD
ncbi:MAG: response regulator [Chloroflexota bacterium]|nr:response regulator transcription factor [Chloroflexota bacterium]MBI5704424.1 response regulator transcription factor [Chloroflexota bacterium]